MNIGDRVIWHMHESNSPGGIGGSMAVDQEFPGQIVGVSGHKWIVEIQFPAPLGKQLLPFPKNDPAVRKA